MRQVVVTSGPVARSKRSTPCSATTMPPQDCATDRRSPVSQSRACCYKCQRCLRQTHVAPVRPETPKMRSTRPRLRRLRGGLVTSLMKSTCPEHLMRLVGCDFRATLCRWRWRLSVDLQRSTLADRSLEESSIILRPTGSVLGAS